MVREYSIPNNNSNSNNKKKNKNKDNQPDFRVYLSETKAEKPSQEAQSEPMEELLEEV